MSAWDARHKESVQAAPTHRLADSPTVSSRPFRPHSILQSPKALASKKLYGPEEESDTSLLVAGSKTTRLISQFKLTS